MASPSLLLRRTASLFLHRGSPTSRNSPSFQLPSVHARSERTTRPHDTILIFFEHFPCPFGFDSTLYLSHLTLPYIFDDPSPTLDKCPLLYFYSKARQGMQTRVHRKGVLRVRFWTTEWPDSDVGSTLHPLPSARDGLLSPSTEQRLKRAAAGDPSRRTYLRQLRLVRLEAGDVVALGRQAGRHPPPQLG